MMLFLHRIFFFLGRGIAILGVPVAVLMVGGKLNDEGLSLMGVLEFFAAMLIALGPLFLFKYVIRVRCPRCGGKLDREMIGAGNYVCEQCGESQS